MQRTLRLPRHLSHRILPARALSRTYSSQSPFKTGPAPPRLPKEEQEIFEKLQQQSTGAFSIPRVNQSPDSSSSATANMQINQSPDSSADAELHIEGGAQIKEGDEFHPNMRRGAPPEFEGDVNPKTGEVGGPKNEPLRWGGDGDWSYNGRVTDF
jgi:hypothetical protein